jgi:hypothetical protein
MKIDTVRLFMNLGAQKVFEKLTTLSPEKLNEVEDFIDFLQQREQEKHLREHLIQHSEAVFNRVWDNDEDALYDKL